MCTMILYLAITLPAWTSDWSETARQVHTWLSARCTHNCQPGTHMAVSQVHTWLSARYTHDCQPGTCITASRVCVITLSEWRHVCRDLAGGVMTVWLCAHSALDINECASSPCQNGGRCNDQVNGFTCDCADGYVGTRCECQCPSGKQTLIFR